MSSFFQLAGNWTYIVYYIHITKLKQFSFIYQYKEFRFWMYTTNTIKTNIY